MALARVTFVVQRAARTRIGEIRNLHPGAGGTGAAEALLITRGAASTRSGAILPEPKTTPFGYVGVVGGVVLGLFIGAAISKNVANFLEENDLFVPSDDDDDDD